jgi:hypothetical protein
MGAMMLDKFTFGNTPAAIYLADRLNELNNHRLTRKISSVLCKFRRTMTELTNANNAGIMCTNTTAMFAERTRVDIQNTGSDMIFKIQEEDCYYDERCINLMVNIICGELKSMIRRLQKAKLANHHLDTLPVGNRPRKLRLHDFSDEITHEILQAKAYERSKRRGQDTKFYWKSEK